MRPLWFDHPGDEVAQDIEDQFLVGPDVLVAPVLEAAATSRRLYLPRGADWRDPWTGNVYGGGDWISVAAPLDVVPFLVRAPSGPRIDRSWFEAPGDEA